MSSTTAAHGTPKPCLVETGAVIYLDAPVLQKDAVLQTVLDEYRQSLRTGIAPSPTSMDRAMAREIRQPFWPDLRIIQVSASFDGGHRFAAPRFFAVRDGNLFYLDQSRVTKRLDQEGHRHETCGIEMLPVRAAREQAAMLTSASNGWQEKLTALATKEMQSLTGSLLRHIQNSEQRLANRDDCVRALAQLLGLLVSNQACFSFVNNDQELAHPAFPLHRLRWHTPIPTPIRPVAVRRSGKKTEVTGFAFAHGGGHPNSMLLRFVLEIDAEHLRFETEQVALGIVFIE